MEIRQVYLDHSATTPVADEVLIAMLPFFSEKFGNPNSLHSWGSAARDAVNTAREQVAGLIGASAKEIIFTGGGSEADNLAVKGAAFALKDKGKGKHLITSAVEHHASLDTFKWLGKNGFDVTVLPVDKEGKVTPDTLKSALRDDTILVSIMYANNEVGTIQPIEQLGSICREKGVLFHSDAVQMAGHLPVDVNTLPVDMLTLSAHKMYGPKGVGALYVRKGIRLVPIIHGGGQEFGIRSGTENTAGIVGFGAAAELAKRLMQNGETERQIKLRDKLLDGVIERIPNTQITGHRTDRLPFHASVCVNYVEGEGMLLRLNYAGIGLSSGSACTSGSLEPSYVLLAMGYTHEVAHGSLRMTLGTSTTEEDIEYVLEKLPPIVETLRAMSPYKAPTK